MPHHRPTASRPLDRAEVSKAMPLSNRARLLRESPRDLLRLLAYAKPYRMRLSIALVSLFVGSALGLSFPQVLRQLIDAAFVEHNPAKLNTLALTLVLLFTAQAAFSFLRS